MHTTGQASVDPNEQKLIAAYITPSRGGAECAGLILWGDIWAEFSVYLNGVYIGGGRTSAASPTLQLYYDSCPIGLTGNDILMVMGEHGGNIPHVLKATLLVELL